MIQYLYKRRVPWLQSLQYRMLKWRYRKPRWISKRGIDIHLRPTVFHPSIFLSTDILLDFLLSSGLKSKSVLELGTGNGFISLYLAKNRNCRVTASDINPTAIEGLIESCERNQVSLTTCHSDLFDNIPAVYYDYILVNPPYYNKDVQRDDGYAFYCGSKYEYFTKFFQQIKPYLALGSGVYVILSDTAKLDRINGIAENEHVIMKSIFIKDMNHETFYIYQLILLQD